MSDAFLPVAAPSIGEREIAFVTDAVKSGWVSSIGPYLDRFESGFASFCGARHAIAVANGTVALHLALASLGIGPGDEVIVPDLTFAATANMVVLTGAEPVLVDVEPDTFCLDPVAVRRALTPRTKAILPVHLYGHPADMTELSAIATEKGLFVIEDAAEAHGARVGETRVGAMGDLGTFSFYGNKILTTGEGGMVTTNDDALAERARFLKDHGMSKERRYFHTELAFNYRMTNVQAALGCAQLERAGELVARKRALMALYRDALEGLPVALNVERPGATSVFWMVCAVLDDRVAIARDELARRLRAEGVDSRPFFVPMSELPHLARFRRVGRASDGCPVARRLSERGLNLPSGVALGEADVARVAQALAAALA